MSVYVDSLRSCFPTNKWPYDQSCHMFADSTAELHCFAESIGLERSYFQDRDNFPHYDLTAGKRREAVRAGAKEVGMVEVVNRMRRFRRHGQGSELCGSQELGAEPWPDLD